MKFEFNAYGHENIRSEHKSTFEITTDENLTPRGDCIIGVGSKTTLADIPCDMKDMIKTDNTKIVVELETPNSKDIITGEGSDKLTLDHPTDMVCRRSDFTCGRTLMIHSDKAAYDLDKKLVEDLKNKKELKITITV